MTEHIHSTYEPGCYRCELRADESPGVHIPGVPCCPDCGKHYVKRSVETSSRRDGQLYWVAECGCMSKRFEAFLAKVQAGEATYDELEFKDVT